MEYKWTALTVTLVGTLISGIDARITVVGLPTIAQQLHAGPEELVWITQVYLLSSTVGLLLIGRIADLFGRVKLYNAGFLIFTIGSGLAAISLNAYQLIAFRAVQGIGFGILVTSSAAIITDASPKKELGTMLGINLTGFRLGNVLGLTIAGLILSVVDWRGLFYINLPIGIFGTIWANRRLKEVAATDASKKMDWWGFAFFSAGLTLILLAVTFLGYGIAGLLQGYGFLLVGLFLLVLFVKVELSTESPLLDFNLFKIRLFAAGNSAQILNSLVWFSIILLVTFYLQIGLGYSPLQAGLGIIPLDGTYLVSSLISARLSDRYGTRALTTIGLSINTACYLTLSTFGSTTPYIDVALILFTVGIGNGMFNSPNIRAIMGSVPSNRVGIASGFRNTMFNTGATISYGVVILLMTIGIPYGSLAALLQGGGPQAALALARTQFFDAFRIATLAMAILDGIAIIPSAMRGKKDQ